MASLSANRPHQSALPDDRALAAEVAERDEVVERRDPAGGEHRHAGGQHVREQAEVGAAQASRRGACW